MQYLISIYFASTTLTTVGYGDVTPVTLVEYSMAVILQVCGVTFFAYSLAVIMRTIETLDKGKGTELERIKQITRIQVRMSDDHVYTYIYIYMYTHTHTHNHIFI